MNYTVPIGALQAPGVTPPGLPDAMRRVLVYDGGMVRQYPLTPAAGKRLIAKGIAAHPWVTEALRSARLVIVAGTTNGYVAEEVLTQIGQAVGFQRRHFFRGITLPPSLIASMGSRPPDADRFPGDVVIDKGVWQRAKTVFDIAPELGAGDLLLKGANALDLDTGQTATFIEFSDGGPTAIILPAVLGRHARLLVPVGLEKRVTGNLFAIDQRLTAPATKGLRLCPLPGQAFTELDAIAQLTGAHATLLGAGGVAGAEGAIWLAVEGTEEQLAEVGTLMRRILGEPAFDLL